MACKCKGKCKDCKCKPEPNEYLKAVKDAIEVVEED